MGPEPASEQHDPIRGGLTGVAGGIPETRRSFLRWLLGLSVVSTLAMIAMPVVGFLVPQKSSGSAAGGRVPVGKVEDFPPGSGKVVAMGNTPAIVVNAEQGVKAFSAVCTHLGCIVIWNDLAGVIQCPCHDGRFSPLTGAVVSGPPPSGLPPITAVTEKDEIVLVAD